MENNPKLYIYYCQNEQCSFSEKRNYKIQLPNPNITQCPYCGNNTLKSKIPGVRVGTGLGGGALLGFTVGGPVGALFGGLIGLGVGLFAEDQDNKK